MKCKMKVGSNYVYVIELLQHELNTMMEVALSTMKGLKSDIVDEKKFMGAIYKTIGEMRYGK